MLQEYRRKKKFKVEKKHLQGFIAGVLVTALLFTGVAAGIYPGFLAGTFTYQAGSRTLQEEIDMQNVYAEPASINAHIDICESFTLDISIDELNTVKKGDIYLWGFFDGMEVKDISSEDGKLKVSINGSPKVKESYNSDNRNIDGHISIYGKSVKKEQTGYTADISVIYPGFTSDPAVLENCDSYETDVALALKDDSFLKTPSAEDITLSGIFQDMELSNISQTGNVLSFHIKGSRNENGINGYVGISGNVLASGFSAEKIIPVYGMAKLFSATPITVEVPFEDTILLSVLNDYFNENISPDMFTFSDGLKDAKVKKVEYIDTMSLYLTLCSNEVRQIGYGTITLSKDALKSGRVISAEIPIVTSSISMRSSNKKILAVSAGTEKEYKLGIFSEGNDFLPTLTKDDFVLKGAVSSMGISDIKWINGYEIELTLKGAPATGDGVISIRSAALGGITGAECTVTVTDTAYIFGHVNLADDLPDLAIAFYDKDGNALNIPSVTTDGEGAFMLTVTSDMPVESIVTVKAANDKMELSARFNWDERENININAFTTLMEKSIENAATEKEGINAVYKYLGFAGSGLASANHRMKGKNGIFSHRLFEKQANGDINGYIRQLYGEMQAGKVRSFAEEEELSGETGGPISDIIGWGLDKIKSALISGIESAVSEGAKTGAMYILRDAGILGPSTDTMLKDLQKTVDHLADQVSIMRDQLSYEIKKAELQGTLNTLNEKLSKIEALSARFNGRKSLMKKELAAYKVKHPDDITTVFLEDLPVINEFFGNNGDVKAADIFQCISDIKLILIPVLGSSVYDSYLKVLSANMPFEHNSCEELHNIVNYVNNIMSTGLTLYSAYCMFNNKPTLEADLQSIKDIVNEINVKLEKGTGGKAAILPSEEVFKLKKKYGGGNTYKLNCNGLLFLIDNYYRPMKDGLISRLDSGDYNCGYARLPDAFFKNLFAKRELYYSYMKPKQFLEHFSGMSLPDWLYTAQSDGWKWFLSHWDFWVYFFDMADNMERKYYASELYNKYSSWVAVYIRFIY